MADGCVGGESCEREERPGFLVGHQGVVPRFHFCAAERWPFFFCSEGFGMGIRAKGLSAGLVLAAAVVGVGLGEAARGATFVYTHPAADSTENWSSGVNWSAVPVSGS